MSDDPGLCTAPDSPSSGGNGHPRKAGGEGWNIPVFLASSWLGAAVVFILYGFNPGGSALKEAKWRGALVLWPSVMALMLGYSFYYRRDPRRFISWVVTLVLMATCPVWFPIFYEVMIALYISAA